MCPDFNQMLEKHVAKLYTLHVNKVVLSILFYCKKIVTEETLQKWKKWTFIKILKHYLQALLTEIAQNNSIFSILL